MRGIYRAFYFIIPLPPEARKRKRNNNNKTNQPSQQTKTKTSSLIILSKESMHQIFRDSLVFELIPPLMTDMNL